MIKIGINGFGRIGRILTREILKNPDFLLVGVNDIYDKDMMLYLLEHDSIYGNYRLKKEFEATSQSDIAKLNWSGVDVVFECSGVYSDAQKLKYHIKNRAKRVILSSYSKELPTYIYGVNEKEYKGEEIISISSCTGNCAVPVLSSIDKVCGIKCANITTIHSYTADQNLLDNKNKDIRRARSSTQNIIPLFSNVSNAITQFMPHLIGKVISNSLRVPVANGVLIDCNIYLKQKSSKQEIMEALKELSDNRITLIAKEQLVSSDIKGLPYSSIINEDLIYLSEDNLLKIMIWQDNEFGYVHRLLDMAKVVCKQR